MEHRGSHTVRMDDADRLVAAAALLDAARTGRAIAPLTATYLDMTVEDAYQIQVVNIEVQVDAGSRVVGRKVGLTSRVMQEAYGVDEPDYGHIMDDMCHPDGSIVRIDKYLQPRVEVEIAFKLNASLRGPGITAQDVRAATECVAPSIEIIASRIADWNISLADTIADNASSGGIVIGPWMDFSDAPPLDAVCADLYKGDDLVASGKGADVLGDPASAVAWLANKMSGLGIGLEAGQIIMPGSCTRAVEVTPGDEVRAVFSDLGSVEVSFK
jgi:2-keto-4-pentenoate hydratase